MNVEIIKEKHIHGNVLEEYVKKLPEMKKQQFEDVVVAYEAYRNGIDSVSGLNNDEIREIIFFVKLKIQIGKEGRKKTKLLLILILN